MHRACSLFIHCKLFSFITLDFLMQAQSHLIKVHKLIAYFLQLFSIAALAHYFPNDTADDAQLVYLWCFLQMIVYDISTCGTRLLPGEARPLSSGSYVYKILPYWRTSRFEQGVSSIIHVHYGISYTARIHYMISQCSIKPHLSNSAPSL
jgi:hypothetical protein